MNGPAKRRRRSRKALLKAFAFGVGAGLFAACARDAPAPLYGPGDCRRATIIDAETGAPIIGAEDIAFDSRNSRLIISAYDRRAAERTVRSSEAPPDGGIYALSVEGLFDAEDALALQSLVNRRGIDDGLRPHGLSLDEASGDILFINRAYVRAASDRRWQREARLVRLDSGGAVQSTAPAHCAANDIAINAHGGLAISADHAACGWRAGLEDVLGQTKSAVFDEDGAVIEEGLGFANGLAAPGGDLIVAATREKRLRWLGGGSGPALKMPGAPDNLSIAPDGALIVALHPSLFRLALNRKLGFGRAGSRIVKVDPATGDTQYLFNDPAGAIFSAATVGVETARGLVVGSVTDAGLLLCEKAP